MTVNEFAALYCVEMPVAYGVLRFLAEKGIIVVSKRPQPDGRKGKPTNIYHLETLDLEALKTTLERIRLTSAQPTTTLESERNTNENINY